MKKKIAMNVNADEVELEVDCERTLLEVLRNDLGLLGAREGCSRGECGACTVLLDDRPVAACLVLAPDADGRSVRTIEGLARDPLQQAFVEHGAIQCGYCTSGMILTAKSGEPIEGNLCRCTGYAKILEAIRECHRPANPQA